MTADEFRAVMKQLRLLGHTYSTVATALGSVNARSLERMAHAESARSHKPVHPDVAARLREMVEQGQQARLARMAEFRRVREEAARKIAQELAGEGGEEGPAP